MFQRYIYERETYDIRYLYIIIFKHILPIKQNISVLVVPEKIRLQVNE